MEELLTCTIRQQDGTEVVMRYANTLTNRQFVDYVCRHEAFSKTESQEEK